MSSAHTVDGRLTVPTIDIRPYGAANVTAAQRDRVAADVDHAARTVGFMQIVGHGVPDETLSAFTEAIDAFFALDGVTKSTYRCPPEVNRGYTPPKSEALANSLGLVSAADLFEAFNVGSQTGDYPDLYLPPEDYPDNVWPQEAATFRTAVGDWFDAAAVVARRMVRIFGHALGLGVLT
jgi:isopenicillin N synthase-like dioxygenase